MQTFSHIIPFFVHTDGAGGLGTWGKVEHTWKFPTELHHFMDKNDPNYDPDHDGKRPTVFEI